MNSLLRNWLNDFGFQLFGIPSGTGWVVLRRGRRGSRDTSQLPAGPLSRIKTESGFDPQRFSLLRNETGQLGFSRLSLGAQNR